MDGCSSCGYKSIYTVDLTPFLRFRGRFLGAHFQHGIWQSEQLGSMLYRCRFRRQSILLFCCHSSPTIENVLGNSKKLRNLPGTSVRYEHSNHFQFEYRIVTPTSFQKLRVLHFVSCPARMCPAFRSHLNLTVLLMTASPTLQSPRLSLTFRHSSRIVRFDKLPNS